MDIDKSSDQLLVRVWKACNFKCNFCNVADNEKNVKLKENIDDIVRNFHYKLKYSNLDIKEITITISWWEPSIFQKETLFALKYIKSFFDKKSIIPHFEIQTNASNIDLDFAVKLKKYWIHAALVSFHMIDKSIFEKIIQVSYNDNFYKIIEWINNLHKAWIEVYTNTILSNENKNNFYETIKYIEKTFSFIKIFNIWMVQPHWEAEKILEKVMPKYEEVIQTYNKSLFYLIKKWKEVISHFVWPPACYIWHIKESLELSENTLFRKKFNFSNKYLINNINDINKIQIKDCDKCLYNNVCSGIWKEYMWLQKLKPVIYKKDYNFNLKNEKNAFWYKLYSLDGDLKKIYDKNIRQIIISSFLWNKDEIYNLLKKSTKIWFYKITLLIDNKFILEEDIFLTWISNIQVNIENINEIFIKKLIIFSNKFKPQFRINLDIFYNKKQIQKKEIILMKKYYNNNFIQFYEKNKYR
jgi:MoaA/NifB/PqqE/SkfB family radical SAM enzyme